MKRLSVIPALFTLAACASDGGGMESYPLGRGLVTYDAMVRAKADCATAGGEVRPKDKGGDPAQLSNYTCVIPPKK